MSTSILVYNVQQRLRDAPDSTFQHRLQENFLLAENHVILVQMTAKPRESAQN